ncbi:MAG: hypothetical protein CL685_00710 [Candidatus Magasanikbacteria bacterium]|nr:hypothetical protein [Candidatus Magasanikbacteria bacterium]
MKSAEYHWVLERASWDSAAQHILFLKQRKAYEYAATFVSGKKVLDYGVGSGFGTLLLSEHASHVCGVDVFPKTIAYCKKFHQKENTKFIRIPDSYTTPFPDNHFDVVTSFQVIEHIPNVGDYLRELARVLKPGGTIIITTPNRGYRLLPFQKPWNEEHVREYHGPQLQKEVEEVFSSVDVRAISGVKEVVSIEHARVKQSPVAVYLRNPIKRLMRLVVPDLLNRFAGASVKKETSLSHYTPTYTTADFFVGEQVENPLDWIVVGKKQ